MIRRPPRPPPLSSSAASGVCMCMCACARMCVCLCLCVCVCVCVCVYVCARPDVLLLDEPTNHLDLEACVWLEGYLAKYKKCLILVSHSQDFLNGVCTHIIWMTQGKLKYYSGNYDSYARTVRDEEVVQQKKYEKEQADITHLKQFISN